MCMSMYEDAFDTFPKNMFLGTCVYVSVEPGFGAGERRYINALYYH